jgi:hypothetical protein
MLSLLKNVYEMLCESSIFCGAELLGLGKGWKGIDKIHDRFCKK